MTIPNPATIAHEIVEDMDPDNEYPHIIQQMESAIAAAIQADRAQREAPIDQDWLDDQENVRDADHVIVHFEARDDEGRTIFGSDVTLTPTQAVGMFDGIGRADR